MQALRRLLDFHPCHITVEDAKDDVGREPVDAKWLERYFLVAVFPRAHLQPLPALHDRRAHEETAERPARLHAARNRHGFLGGGAFLGRTWPNVARLFQRKLEITA